jgi:hypothetical protein
LNNIEKILGGIACEFQHSFLGRFRLENRENVGCNSPLIFPESVSKPRVICDAKI